MNLTEIFKRWLRIYLDFLEEATNMELETGFSLDKMSNLGETDTLIEVFGDAEEAELGAFMKMMLSIMPTLKKLEKPFEVKPDERLNLINEMRDKIPK